MKRRNSIKLTIKIFFAVLIISIAGCFPKAPIVEKCAFVQLDPKPALPPVNFVFDETLCPFYACITELEFKKLRARESLLRLDSNYTRNVYNSTMERCK